MSVKIEIEPGFAITVDSFRQAKFEPFAEYALAAILEYTKNRPTNRINTMRCSISGFPVATVTLVELRHMVYHASAALRLDRFNDLLLNPTDAEIESGIEMLVDHLASRLLMLSKPGAALSFSNGVGANAALPRSRQLAILLNQLLWDAGQFRDSFAGYEDLVQRLTSSATIADQIIQWYGIAQTLELTHAALIELDAKYCIAKLVFTRKEMQRLRELREAVLHNFDPAQILEFTLSLITYRDSTLEQEPYPARWTQHVYRAVTYEAVARPENSNLPLNVPTTGAILGSNISGGSSAKAAKTPKTPEEKAKAAQKAAMADLISGMFGTARK